MRSPEGFRKTDCPVSPTGGFPREDTMQTRHYSWTREHLTALDPIKVSFDRTTQSPDSGEQNPSVTEICSLFCEVQLATIRIMHIHTRAIM